MNDATGSAEILNIARSAGPLRILGVLNPQEIKFLAKFTLHGIFTKIMIFHENLKFHDQMSNLKAAITFSHKFSGSSRVENLIRHIKISDWTKTNSKRFSGSRAIPEKLTEKY